MAAQPAEHSALCERLRERDEAAFNVLVAAYANELRRALIALGHRPGVAEDLTQEAFVRAWHRSASCPPPGRLLDWLCGFALEAARARVTRS